MISQGELLTSAISRVESGKILELAEHKARRLLVVVCGQYRDETGKERRNVPKQDEL